MFKFVVDFLQGMLENSFCIAMIQVFDVASKRFQRSGQTKRNKNSKKEKKEKEGFYAFHKAEKQRSGKYIYIYHTHDCFNSTQCQPTSL